MISKTGSASVNNAYNDKMSETKNTKQSVNISKQGDMSRIEQLKESIDSGEYRVDLEALSKKIADELL